MPNELLFSHVKWFADNPTDASSSINQTELVLVVVFVLLGLALLYWLNQLKSVRSTLSKLEQKLSALNRYAPTVVRVSFGLMLVLNSLKRNLLAPNIEASGEVANTLIYLYFVLGLMLLIGIYVRAASALLIILFFISVYISGNLTNLIEHLEQLGVSIYLLIRNGGIVKEKLTNKAANLLKRLTPYSLPILQISIGASLFFLALTEKLLNLNLASTFLAHHDWNFLSSLGVSDHQFIIIAGVFEMIFGLSLILNIAPKLTTLALLALFVTTALLLGVEEVIGHLFAVGLVFEVWCTKNTNSRPWLFGFYKY